MSTRLRPLLEFAENRHKDTEAKDTEAKDTEAVETARVLPFIQQRFTRWVAPASAAAALTAAALVLVLLPGMPSPESFDGYAQLTALETNLPAELAASWKRPTLAATHTRGPDDRPAAVLPAEDSFRLGVSFVDLQVALAAGSYELVNRAYADLADTAKESNLDGQHPVTLRGKPAGS